MQSLGAKGPKAVFTPSESQCKSENVLWCLSFSLSLGVNRPLEMNYSKQLENGQEETAYQLQSCQVLLPPKILLHMWPQGSKAIVGVHTYVHKWIAHSYKPSWKINKSTDNKNYVRVGECALRCIYTFHWAYAFATSLTNGFNTYLFFLF